MLNIYMRDAHHLQVEELLAIPAKNPINRMWFWSTVALGVGGIVLGVNLLRQR